jgi:hypothetical protein
MILEFYLKNVKKIIMSCTVLNAGGANKDCVDLIGAMDAPLITLPDVKWTSRADFQNTETMRVKIQEDLGVYVTRKISGADITQPEARNETTGFGAQVTTGVTPGSVIVYLESNSCDFNEMMSAYNGGTFRIVPFGEDGYYDGYLMPNGEIKGFEAQIYAVPISVASVDNQVQQWKLLINWKNAEQFRSRVRVKSPKTLEGLLEWMPSGLTALINTAYDTGTGIQVIDVSKRCSTDIETEVLTGEVLDNGNVLSPTASPTSNADGTYDATIQKGAVPGNLANGDYLTYRVVKKTGSVYEKISNAIPVNPNA